MDMTPHDSLQVDEAFRLLGLIASMVNKVTPCCVVNSNIYLFVVITDINERSFMVFS